MNSLYGIFKNLSFDNHYDSLAKALNSAQTTQQTKATLREVAGVASHGGYLVIHKGICYTAYIRNYGVHNDDPFCPTLVTELAIFPLERALSEDFDIEKDGKVICFDKAEEITGDIKRTSAFFCTSICPIGDVLHLNLSCEVEGKRNPLFHVTYDTVSGKFSRATETEILYNGERLPFEDLVVDKIYADHGQSLGAPGMVLTSARWSEYKGDYYTSFMLDGREKNCGMIIKTKDFDTYEFVSVVPENENGGAEIATCIFEDKLYLACRQEWTTPYLLFSRYDLEKKEWKEPYAIQDANSRPWMFVYKNELYLYNTIDEGWRRYANISKVRTDRKAYNFRTSPINTIATIYGCGAYHSFFVYEDRIFFACSYMATMCFGELKLKDYSPEKVNERLVELLGE